MIDTGEDENDSYDLTPVGRGNRKRCGRCGKRGTGERSSWDELMDEGEFFEEEGPRFADDQDGR